MFHTLYVIGNGFDRHHGIPSSYFDFGEYLKQVDHETYRLVENYLAFDDDFWSYFETRLSDLDVDSLLQDAGQFFVNYSAEDWSDSYHHDYQYEIDRVVAGLSFALKRRFTDWVRQLPIPSHVGIESKLVGLESQATFLTFNYTRTLQELYGIDRRKVLHIHGNATDPEDELILGHGWDPALKGSLNPNVDPEQDSRVTEGSEIIDQYFRRTFKPTIEIIKRNAAFFDGLGATDRIVVMGHSLADVDLPYFHEIVRHIDRNRVKWKISYYASPDAIHEQFRYLGIDLALVQFALLNEF